MAKTGFFTATGNSINRISKFYDWFSPALIGLHRLKSLVRKRIEKDDVDEKILEKCYNKGSGIRWSAYHKMVCRSWQGLCSEAASALINEGCSTFEGWLEEVFDAEFCNDADIFVAFNSKGSRDLRDKAIKGLQFPDPSMGYEGVLKYLKKSAPLSATYLSQAVVPELKKSTEYTNEMLGNLLKYYRFIKECRNSYVHSGGKATKKCCEAYNQCLKLSCKDLGLGSLPSLPLVKEGNKIVFDLYLAKAFVSIILRIIKIYDIELVESRVGVESFKRRWLARHGNLIKTFSADKKVARNQLYSWLKSFYKFKMADEDSMRRFLEAEDLCKFV